MVSENEKKPDFLVVLRSKKTGEHLVGEFYKLPPGEIGCEEPVLWQLLAFLKGFLEERNKKMLTHPEGVGDLELLGLYSKFDDLENY